MRLAVSAVLILAVVAVLAAPAPALAQRAQQAPPARVIPPIARIDFDKTAAEQCFLWWGVATGQHVVINWDRLEAAGYDRSYPVTMQLANVRPTTALRLLLSECFPNGDVIAEVRPQYTRIMTKAQANENPVVRVYAIGDMIVNVPNFDGAPKFSLEDSAADAGGSGGNNIFEPISDDEPQLSKEDRINRFLDAIRQNIEPDIWHANGGRHASMSYLNGSLIVRAPEYVQKQIGLPRVQTTAAPTTHAPRGYTAGPSTDRRSASMTTAGNNTDTRRSNGVGGVAPRSPY